MTQYELLQDEYEEAQNHANLLWDIGLAVDALNFWLTGEQLRKMLEDMTVEEAMMEVEE
jgi:hypothetical protein